MIIRIALLYTLIKFSRLSNTFRDENVEELFIKPLSTGHVFNHFQFTTTLNSDLSDNIACLYFC